MFNKKTVKDLDLRGKRVLLRADFNVPILNGKIEDDYRIEQALPTINYLLDHGASVVIISHLGRPEGRPNKDMSLKPIAGKLSELLDRKVEFVDDCTGDKVRQACAGDTHKVVLLENLRFHPEEEKNDIQFAKQIAEDTSAHYFVQDGFGVVHRAHASTEAIARILPSAAGLLLANEVSTINGVMLNPNRPLMAVIGGAKIADKEELLSRFINIADFVAVVGALANNFLLVEGHKVGSSLIDEDGLGITKKILDKAKKEETKRNFNFIIPTDVVVSESVNGNSPTRIVELSDHLIEDIQAYPKIPKSLGHTIGAKDIIVDIGPLTAGMIAGAIKMAGTVIWNGTAGIAEIKGISGAHDPFAHGTRVIADAIAGESNSHANKSFSVVGGGDTVSYISSQGMLDDFSHVSTGGGASLELMAGHKLPGVEVLPNR